MAVIYWRKKKKEVTRLENVDLSAGRGVSEAVRFAPCGASVRVHMNNRPAASGRRLLRCFTQRDLVSQRSAAIDPPSLHHTRAAASEAQN